MTRPIDLIHEIQQLPVNQRFDILEAILLSIKKEEINKQIEKAAAALYDDYASDPELTAFTSLDFEHFYEAR